MNISPPFSITAKIMQLSESIAYELGRLSGEKAIFPSVKLRRSNQIKTIQASLAIEGNTLSLKQVTDILEGKSVLGPQKDILEVKNAIDVYAQLKELNPLNYDHLLKVHEILMKSLIEHSGEFRTEPVGIYKDGRIAHLAPLSDRVEHLVLDLLRSLQDETNVSWLIKSCVFLYEFEFIHPFIDGNGRMGRLWQQLLLIRYNPIFEYVPVEEIVRNHQQKYFDALGASDKAGNSTEFIEFMLSSILEALKSYRNNHGCGLKSAIDRLIYAKQFIKDDLFTRQTYLELHRDVSLSTASRDLKRGVEQKILSTVGAHNRTQYRYS